MNRFVMNDTALENYGEEYRDVVLVEVSKANKYMPAKEFYAEGMPKGYHPGFDNGVKNSWLYELKREDNQEMLNFALYTWELTRI